MSSEVRYCVTGTLRDASILEEYVVSVLNVVITVAIHFEFPLN